LNLVGTVRFIARAAIDPNRGAAAGAADGKAVAEAVVAAAAATGTGTGIAGDTEQLASHTGMCH
jgi:hypothetical protein